jgi:hypothetical protein
LHQHGAFIAANSEQLMGRSRGGLTTKIHAVVYTSGLPVRVALTNGEVHYNRWFLPIYRVPADDKQTWRTFIVICRSLAVALRSALSREVQPQARDEPGALAN